MGTANKRMARVRASFRQPPESASFTWPPCGRLLDARQSPEGSPVSSHRSTRLCSRVPSTCDTHAEASWTTDMRDDTAGRDAPLVRHRHKGRVRGVRALHECQGPILAWSTRCDGVGVRRGKRWLSPLSLYVTPSPVELERPSPSSAQWRGRHPRRRTFAAR